MASLTPVFLLLDRPETGLPGTRTVSLAWSQLRSGWWGGLTVMGAGLALAMLLPVARIREALAGLGARLRRPRPWPFALGLGAVAGVLALATSRLVFGGLPTLEDGMAMLVHARYLAGGQVAGALPEPAAGWLIPNTLQTAEGWISQYPPLHPLLLAAGLRAGAAWLVGPVLLAATVALAARVAEMALEGRRATARTGAALAAGSPFLIFLGAGYLSHVSAAFFAAVALYAALRTERSGRARWPVLTGLAAGGLVASRPWTGLALGVALPVGLWTAGLLGDSEGRSQKEDRSSAESGGRELVRRLLLAAAGGAPVAASLGLYNLRFFGHPLRFGYTASYGGAHLPGFHRDPWGNLYGLREAIGYTGADLVSLGVHLLETPLPAVAVVGGALLLLRRLPRGSGVLLAWALLPVAANALYWHHGFHMGPRMLYEAAPAWSLLVGVAAIGLVRSREAASSSGAGGPIPFPLRRRLRDGLLLALLLSLPAGALLALQRARSYAWSPDTLARIRPPNPPSGEERALVFVHGSWSERVAARLRAAGMGADSVETAMRRNDLCSLHEYALDRERDGDAVEGVSALDFRVLPGRPDRLQPVEVTAGYRVWRDPQREWGERCRRELAADRGGVVSLAPLLWQGDLPGTEGGRPMYVRDLGPEKNRELRDRFPSRPAYLYHVSGPGESPNLRPYREGIERLW